MAANDNKPTKLLWMDLEMTGLDPGNDLILEVAVIVSDFNFKELARYESLIQHERSDVVDRLASNSWWQNFPANRDEFISRLEDGKPQAQVESDLITLVAQQFGDQPAILAGNSIHQDRKFIAKYWPNLDRKLHYRMLDVTSLKIYMIGKYNLEYEKKDAHRALGDIQESMAEWQYYMTKLQSSELSNSKADV